MNTWNAQYNEPTTERKIPKWADLSEEQQDSAIQLCYYKTSWEKLDLPTYGYGHPIAKPATRFVEWKDVNSIHRSQLEQNLGYNELTWNVIRLNDVEQKGWFEFFNYEKDTASAVLGLDESSWDCWINHYDSYGWSDLVRRGLDEHWKAVSSTELSLLFLAHLLMYINFTHRFPFISWDILNCHGMKKLIHPHLKRNLGTN